jgi:hypothetical protein
MTTARKRVVWSVTSGILSVILSCGFAVGYVTYQNQKWCETLSILTQTDPRTQPLPSTPLGKDQRPKDIQTYDRLVKLRTGFHCGDGR